MTPRSVEEARAWIHNHLDCWYGEEYARLTELLDDLLRAHAHELTEKLRHCSFAAADLIDPEAAKC
ncbi:hypothetical protein ACFV1L_10370 [Kitasatospora sp. NPDC059646]|uniref:hypothetical protein n=1 Tax=Kitasatospora sp. NPDC059646 TaxID=3346893 RepID=UPI0036B53B20